jgi:hypothetical protein
MPVGYSLPGHPVLWRASYAAFQALSHRDKEIHDA